MTSKLKNAPWDMVLWSALFFAMALVLYCVPGSLLDRKWVALKVAFGVSFPFVFAFWYWHFRNTGCDLVWRWLTCGVIIFCIGWTISNVQIR